MRLPNSSAAWIPTARAVPTPLTLVRVATGCDARSRSDPRHVESISCPIPRADRPSDPLPRSIAMSSLELRACAPCVRSRSRGRSAVGSSRIVSAIDSPVRGNRRMRQRYRRLGTLVDALSSALCAGQASRFNGYTDAPEKGRMLRIRSTRRQSSVGEAVIFLRFRRRPARRSERIRSIRPTSGASV
jgi:hypothetical protein